MTPAELILTDALVSGLGLTLLHFLWQGSLVALGLWMFLRLRASAAPTVRYGAACGALLTMAVLPIVTMWAQVSSGAMHPAGLASPGQPHESIVTVANTGTAVQAAGGQTEVHGGTVAQAGRTTTPGSPLRAVLPWLVTFWMAGVTLLGLRLGGGWVYTLRLRRLSARAASPAWEATVHRLARVIGVRRPVRVLESAAVGVPTIVGWLKPMLLLPAAALSGLPPAQVGALIAHELAHIRRHDFIVNFLQSVVETLLFYHPAVWWVSRRIRIEREFCCDDEAVRACGDPLEYARGLTALEERRADLLALAATGGSLVDRIRRLLGEPAVHPRSGGLMAATLLISAALVPAGFVAGAGAGTAGAGDGGLAIVEDRAVALAGDAMVPIERQSAAGEAGDRTIEPEPGPTILHPTIESSPTAEGDPPAERALAGIRAARGDLDQEIARVTAQAAALPDGERERVLARVLRQLERHRVFLERAEAEILRHVMESPDVERRQAVAEERIRRLEARAERVAEEARRRAGDVQLSPELLRQIEEDTQRMAGEVRKRLEESEAVRDAFRHLQEDAARMALEASRVAAEVVRIESDLVKELVAELVAEAQRVSADVMRQMDSPEWQQRMREIERAIEAAVRAIDDHRRTRPPHDD